MELICDGFYNDCKLATIFCVVVYELPSCWDFSPYYIMKKLYVLLLYTKIYRFVLLRFLVGHLLACTRTIVFRCIVYMYCYVADTFLSTVVYCCVPGHLLIYIGEQLTH